MKVFKLLFITTILATVACSQQVAPFSVAHIDQSVSSHSRYPNAVNPARVGSYSGQAKSGAGYFYDEVLEYRVWLNPKNGASRIAGNEDYFAAFAQYESALAFSKAHEGAEEPLALVRQIESINEPSPGVYQWDKEERITEWRVKWLLENHRRHDSIHNFLQQHSASEQ